MLEVLNYNGRVYFIIKKKVVSGVVIIGFEKHKASEFEIYLTEELKSKNRTIMTDLISELKEAAAFNNLCVKVIIWGDEIIADKTMGRIGDSAISIGMCMGMLFGMMLGQAVFNDIALGMCFDLGIGAMFGATYYAGANKKEVINHEESTKKEN